MSLTAPLHDMLIRIKNAYMARRTSVAPVVYSKFKVAVLNMLKRYGYIHSFDIQSEGNKKSIYIHLNEVYNVVEDIPVIKFYSTPSRRFYVAHDQIKTVASWQWLWIMSTSLWLLPSHIAKVKWVWWELIAEIY